MSERVAKNDRAELEESHHFTCITANSDTDLVGARTV